MVLKLQEIYVSYGKMKEIEDEEEEGKNVKWSFLAFKAWIIKYSAQGLEV